MQFSSHSRSLWWATDIYNRIDALRMPDPDPDSYDAGYNAAIDRALTVLNEIVHERLTRTARL